MTETLYERARRLYDDAAGGGGGGDLGARMGRFARMMGLDCWSTFMILGGLILIAMLMHPSLLTLMMLLLVFGWQFIIREVAHLEGAMSHKAGRQGIRWAVIAVSCAVIAFATFMMLRINWLAL